MRRRGRRGRVRCAAGAVKPAVAQHQPFCRRKRRGPAARAKRRPARSRPAGRPHSRPAERPRDKAEGRARNPGDALRDQTARAGLTRRRDEVGVPSSRMRALRASAAGLVAGSRISERSVSWWMMISGFAPRTALASASASKTSTTTGSTPTSRRRSAFSGERVVPQAKWPAARRRGVSLWPMTPAAPARISGSRRFVASAHRAFMPADIC